LAGTEVRPARDLLAKRVFVDVPFRLHGHDPAWVPPLRLSVYDRLSRRHPAAKHQRWALWTALRDGRPVGRIGACIDSLFNQHQGEAWAWVGFFEAIDDLEVARSLFDVALEWSRRQGAATAVGPGSFTTNDEVGLLVDGFDTPATLLTTENPRYYERLWVDAGWEQAMDLYGYQFLRYSTALSERQLRTLERLRQRSKVQVRELRMDDFQAEVGRFFELYNQIWKSNWGFAPMPEAEIRHLAASLRWLVNPRWIFALERDGDPVAVCLAIADFNRLLAKVRDGRLFPTGWVPLAFGSKKLKHVRVIALGIRADVQSAGLGPLLYSEIVNRLYQDGMETAEASWTLATNHRINKQLEDLGARRYKTWRLYQKQL
jgi:GNAT superfamily N-acetyltransferase